MITVTKTFLPPIAEYMHFVQRAWDKQWLTNRGELVLELEGKLRDYLKVQNILIVNNGTIPLQIALKLFGNDGEIITTPFSYVATTAAIVWEHCKPVFVDIHPEFLTIDETKIETAITPKTTAILATHVFGNPCHVEAIESIAKKYNLAVIYDAAHAFGVNYNGESLFNFGDVSTCSFHATKLFHTSEGGAFFCKDAAVHHRLFYSHNFGHNGPHDFHGVGINAKISELQAAMGLAVFPHLAEIIAARKEIVSFYGAHLNFNRLRTIKIRENTVWNYSYYPVIFDSEAQLLKTEQLLLQNDIMPRRYFYPSLNMLPYCEGAGNMPVSEQVAAAVLCLPLYVGLERESQQKIVSLVNASL
ncbi:MAG TPA: DegT/DnrJ/EryC1/StrS family aminotransferase [Flavobacterium sp.]|nr:DegT/DnrJ/EryC1/StrS family aminotransferase [Flavobacterium sp.]HPJ11664.1 DegT/DnrJ/EryC1/StrS family aminotransferase [Flavobacterium sp.]